MSLIEVKNAFKSYKSKSDSSSVLNGFNMQVKKGKIYSLMGSSGCGKTTLISCIVGVLKLDAGEIRTFGESSALFQRSRVGFMPQEAALCNNFKIREMLWFFGTIYGLSVDKIEEKIHFLSTLLELPDMERLVKNCSGGQQRRISFAVTLIHDPDLLILDEPTVGVDPLLRERIWDHLVELTRTRNVTILLSTHYIEEAKQSDQIGLMRNGVLIAEDSPQRIMQMCETTDMEQAFLKLSQKQEIWHAKPENSTDLELRNVPGSSNVPLEAKTIQEMPKTDRKRPRIMTALLTKHFLEDTRNYGLLLVTFVLPIIQCFGINYGIGNRLSGFVFGVVNDEVSSYTECFNSSLKTFELQGFDCILRSTSCRFIDDFDQSAAELKFYDSYDEAYQDAKRAEIIGFLYFSPNFTTSLPMFNDDGVENDFSDAGNVQVFLDNTNMQITTLIKKEIYDTFQRFMERIMTDCGKSKNAGGSPITFEALFGTIDFSMRQTIGLGFIITIAYFFASLLMATSLIDERSSGVWNRVIVAGVKPQQFLISHLIEGFVVILIQLIGISIFVSVMLSDAKTANAITLMVTFLLLFGIFGIVFGIFASIICDTVSTSMYFNQFFFYPSFYVSGIIWPVEAQPKFLQFFGHMLPFSYPAIAMRSVALKDSTIDNYDVQMAFLVLLVWIVANFGLSIFFIKRK